MNYNTSIMYYMSGPRDPWCRHCPSSVTVRPCTGDDKIKGNGLFSCVAAAPGELLIEEEPVCGTAILMFDEDNAADHCMHCTVHLPSCNEAVACPNRCGSLYCSTACLEDALWAHHAALCPAKNKSWAAFEKHARECSNEYYILAARSLALVRHQDQNTNHTTNDNSDTWSAMPWSCYASRPWWETMRRPAYASSSDSEGEVSPATNIEAEVESPGSAKNASSANEIESDGDNDNDSDSQSNSSSLDRFFVSQVRQQTIETAKLLQCALSEGSALSSLSGEFLADDEALGRLVGLLRVNALAVRSASAEDLDDSGSDSREVRGMAIYAIACAMNHSSVPNCYVASDPDVPHRCCVRAYCQVSVGDELCINYLEGAAYAVEEKRNILQVQYSIYNSCAEGDGHSEQD